MKAEKKETLNIKKVKVVELPTRNAIYIKLFGGYKNLDFSGSGQQLWLFVKENKLYSTGIEHRAIYYDDPKVTESDKLQTNICLVINKEAKPQGNIGVKELKGGKFAIFYKHMESYIKQEYKRDDIFQKELNLSFINGFEDYLRTERKCSTNTICLYMIGVKHIAVTARNSGQLTINPFAGYTNNKISRDMAVLTDKIGNKYKLETDCP